MLPDQFISVCNKDLALFLKERIPKTIVEMRTLADQFKEARQVSILSLVSSSRKETSFEQKNSRAGKDQRNQKEQTSRNESQQSSIRTGFRRDGRCYKCSRPVHIASQCYQPSKRNRSMQLQLLHLMRQ